MATCCGNCEAAIPDLPPMLTGGEAIDMDLEWPDPDAFTVDHLIPLSELEEDDPRRVDPDYLAPAHGRCNSSRQNMPLAEWRAKQATASEINASTSRDWL